jgi:hypothetical protein
MRIRKWRRTGLVSTGREDGRRRPIPKIAAEKDDEKTTTTRETERHERRGYEEEWIARITANKTEEEGTRKVDEPDRRTDIKWLAETKCRRNRKWSFAGGSSNPEWGNNQLVRLWTEKQEAMNGTGDMARNPRIKGDAVTPKQKVGGQKRGTSLSVTYYRDVASARRGEKASRRRTGNGDDKNENAVE